MISLFGRSPFRCSASIGKVKLFSRLISLKHSLFFPLPCKKVLTLKSRMKPSFNASSRFWKLLRDLILILPGGSEVFVHDAIAMLSYAKFQITCCERVC